MASRGTPIWIRPEPGARKPRFSRERIAAAALKIADDEGFEQVSMRRVAAALGAGTMTLYHYVQTKDDLVALMDDALMEQLLVPEAQLEKGWREALGEIARRTRATFVHHPWALVSLQGAMPGPNGMRHFEQCLAALAGTRLHRGAKLELIALVDDFVFGHALRSSEARRDASVDLAALEAIAEYGKAQLATGRFPHTEKTFAGMDTRRAAEAVAGDARRFERGLQMLFDGAARRFKLRG
jgi:AcrR family transcriptional regulator